ncbi:hypothetical protein LTR84_001255 [Exophiala bonariae]|uniref:Uncharacterized protein n=1 Tax=Exophiala bonariae TaxID=1690606 RepID=A0AAV9NVL2_9EURO|nr:hypothetical protein LTR84_001255 [Exophiala bonariae]
MLYMENGMATYVQKWEPFVAQGRYGGAQQGNGNKYKENFVFLGLKDGNTLFVDEDVDTPNEQESSTKADS